MVTTDAPTTKNRVYLLQDLRDGVTYAFCSDDNAGVENYSHASGPPRFAIAKDFFDVFGEVRVQDGRPARFFFVRLSKGDALGDRPAYRLSRREHGHRLRTVLDHNFGLARTRASSAAKSLAASASETRITRFAMTR